MQVGPSEADSHAAAVLMHDPMLFYMQETACATAIVQHAQAKLESVKLASMTREIC